jgi:predicted acetyltransferase
MTISLKEVFNYDVGMYIVKHFDRYEEEISSVSRRNSVVYTPKQLIFNYVEKSLNGKKTTEYNQSYGEGRLQAKHSLSLQNLPRRFRHSVARGIYRDYDMKNAHPVILLFLCKMYGLSCKELEYYVENREKCLEEIKGVSRENAKRAYLALTNGGRDVGITNLSSLSSHFQAYRSEMNNLHLSFTQRNPEDYEKWCKYKKERGKESNLPASFVNSLLCKWENRILGVLMEYFNIKEGDTAVLCFDGIMVKEDQKCDLIEMSKLVKSRLGIDMVMSVKDFDNPLNLTGDIPKAPRITFDYFTDFTKLQEKGEVELEWLEMWRNNTMALVGGHGDFFFMTKGKVNGNDVWRPVKKQKCLTNLDVEVYCENPDYDDKYVKRVSTMTAKELKEEKKKPDYKKKIQKWSYTSIKKYLEDIINKGKIHLYQNIGFQPYLLRDGCEDYFFNTFTPFPYDGSEYVDEKIFIESIWHKHLKEEMCEDEGEFNHFMDFIADALQDPLNLKETAHVIYGKQGVGKGTLTEFLRLLVGTTNIVSIGNASQYLKSNFNMDSANKLFKVFEELKANESVYKHSDRMKDIISSPKERVEPKGFEAYHTPNVSRCLFFSNNEDCVRVERGDRRYTLHKFKDTYARNIEYFSKIRKEFEDEEFLKSAFHFFINRKYKEINVRIPYETNYKKEQRLNHEHRSVKFIIKFCEENIGASDEPVFIDKNVLDDMYMDEWKITIRQRAQTELKKKLGEMGVGVVRRKRDGEQQTAQLYVLYPTKLEKALQTILDDNTFTIDFLDRPHLRYYPE